MNPWLGMAIVLGIFVAFLVLLRAFQSWCQPHPELARKLLHMAMGLLTLSFPWLFNQVWPIVVLGLLSAGAMLALRYVRSLNANLGCVVTGVSRTTLGEVYFPLSVGILFILYLHDDHPSEACRLQLYCIPILLLTFADASAALIGVRYGQARYATSEGHKSLEGSLAFFFVAFFCAHLPLLLATEVDRANVLLISLLLAGLAMMFEAIAWAGLDNFALPLISYVLLKTYLDLTVEELLLRLAVTAALMVFALVYSRRSTLVGSAIFGIILVGYVSWALGGWPWLLPPLVLFLSYTMLSPRTPANIQRIHNIHAVVCVSSAGLIWLFLYRIFDREDFHYLFTLSFAAHLAIIGIARLGFDYPTLPAPRLLFICTVQGWLLLFVPYLVMHGFSDMMVTQTLVALPVVALAALFFYSTQPQVRDCPCDAPRWLRQAASAGLASALGLLPLALL